MSTTATQPASDTAEAAADPRVVHAETRLAKLREASDLTLDVMRVTARQAIESAEPPPAQQDPEPAAAPSRPAAAHVDPVERLAKLNRMLRMAIALEEKLEAALVAYLAGEVVKADAARALAEEDADDNRELFERVRTGRRGVVRRLVLDVADREIPDPRDYDFRLDALDERLIFDEAYDTLEDAPLRDIVERLCADLQLNPDWRLWTGDGWKPSPPLTRRRCSLFAQPSRKPILEDDDDPDPIE